MPHFLSKQEAIIWRSYRRVPVSKLPYNQRHWVLDRGSLTKRLIHASKGNFKVKISCQNWALPSLDERNLLNLPLGQRALIREVSLLCGGVIWVKARSIIPLRTLTGAEQQLARLGERPLGAFLFKSKTMKRGPLQIASFRNNKNKNISARRSIFFLQDKPILVSEFFMPAVFASVGKNE
ncbi:MAG: chorismate--pyruvate lyase [Oleiphilaceae bacterium]|jgi:chorismate--pyruvate lyase